MPFSHPKTLLSRACIALALYEQFEANLLDDDGESLIDYLTDSQYNLMMEAQAVRNEVLEEYRRQEAINAAHEAEWADKRCKGRMFYGIGQEKEQGS